MASRRQPLLYIFLTMIFLFSFQSLLISRSLFKAYFQDNGGLMPMTFNNNKKKKNRLVWFLHFHKAAGTSFTDLAWKNNGEIVRHARYDNTASVDRHGHLELDRDGKVDWNLLWPVGNSTSGSSTTTTTCDSPVNYQQQTRALQQALHKLHSRGITFTSTEHWFPPPSVLQNVLQQYKHQVMTVVLMREPMERLVSSYHFHKGGANRCPLAKRKCPFRQWWHAESNVCVKMLNGIPFGPIKLGHECLQRLFYTNVTQQMYDTAQTSLESFDIVLTLQSVQKHSHKGACVLRKMLGWSNTTLPKKNVKRRRHQTGQILKEELERAKAENVWDIQLYKRAQELEQDLFQRLGCSR